MLGQPPVFIAIQGEAELIRDTSEFEAHWIKDLQRWFENGVDTPGLVLIKVHANSNPLLGWRERRRSRGLIAATLRALSALMEDLVWRSGDWRLGAALLITAIEL